MWVVIIGLVPLLWYFGNLLLEQRSDEVQLRFWITFGVIVAALGIYINIVSGAGAHGMGAGTHLLIILVAFGLAVLIFKGWFRLNDFVHERCEKKQTGLFGELCSWIVIDVVLFVAVIVLGIVL